MKIVLCTCCMAEVTKPVFIKGKPYGYSCANKISKGTIKRPIKKIVELHYGKIEINNDTWKTIRMIEMPNGKKFRCDLYLTNDNKWTAMYKVNNFTMIGNKLFYEL